jgi:lysophospholipase L1-like esterase
MRENMIPILNKNCFMYRGRILEKNNSVYLGFTNSSVEFYVKGNDNNVLSITANISTKLNGTVNEARLKIFIDDYDTPSSILILNKEKADYHIASFGDNDIHKITIIKITEAAMSYAAINEIIIKGGDILELPIIEDKKLKIEFLGDSITCGSGVHGLPDSLFHMKYEDGLYSYAALTAKALNLDARYFCVSGYGIFTKYDGDLDGIIPKVYPYTNYFIDKTIKYDTAEFIPDIYVINLGTNDSGHIHKTDVAKGFVNNYIELLQTLKRNSPDAKILCTCGTLCTNVFSYIIEAVNEAKKIGLNDIHTLEFPYHNVLEDGMASCHPSIKTHEKDSKLLINKLKEIINI